MARLWGLLTGAALGKDFVGGLGPHEGPHRSLQLSMKTSMDLMSSLTQVKVPHRMV